MSRKKITLIFCQFLSRLMLWCSIKRDKIWSHLMLQNYYQNLTVSFYAVVQHKTRQNIVSLNAAKLLPNFNCLVLCSGVA